MRKNWVLLLSSIIVLNVVSDVFAFDEWCNKIKGK